MTLTYCKIRTTAALALVCTAPFALSATEYIWDPSTTTGIQYANGVWDTSTPNWTTDSGASNTTYVSGANEIAFPSSAGTTAVDTVTITLTNSLVVQQIGMGSGYDANVVITDGGSNARIFLGGSHILTNNNTTKTLRIDAVITENSGLRKVNAGTVILSKNNTYTGGTQIEAGTLQIGAGGTTGTLGSGNVVNNATLAFNRSDLYTVTNIISGTGTITKTGAGTLMLAGENTYTGQTTIWAGTIQLGDNERLADTAALRFGNSGTFATAGFSETLGILTISNGAQAVIDFGNGTSALTFADSHSVAWSGTLTLANFTVGVNSLRFGTSASALTADQLNAISLAGYTAAALDANGYVIFAAIPESSTYALFLSGVIVMTVLSYRRKNSSSLIN